MPKSTKARWPSGRSKKIIEKFAEQFAALSDGYLKERAGDLRTLGQRLLFHLDDSIQGPNTWPARIILVADELSATTPCRSAAGSSGRCGGARWRRQLPCRHYGTRPRDPDGDGRRYPALSAAWPYADCRWLSR
ncbi:hypothetical protein LNP17_25355 [Klebsiella variicola subsp. variicola]|nr:hypothetical protein [Klebsiella variicola subsp. variicola]